MYDAYLRFIYHPQGKGWCIYSLREPLYLRLLEVLLITLNFERDLIIGS
jgi:hypothetical protein